MFMSLSNFSNQPQQGNAYSRRALGVLQNSPKNPLYANNLLADFRLNSPARLIRSVYTKKGIQQGTMGRRNKVRNDQVWDSFKAFINLNISTSSRIFKPHPSFFYFFLSNIKGGVAVMNVSRLLSRWQDMHLLLTNLTHYRVEFLSFGTRFFKDEVLASN